MFVIILIVLSYLYIWRCWPEAIADAIRKRDGGGEDLAGRLIWIIAFWFTLFWVVLVIGAGSQKSWFDAEPVIKSVGLTVAIFFTYTMFVPPSFRITFLPIDPVSEEISREGDTIVTIEKNKLMPIYIAVYNTGIVSWESHRITFQFDDVFETKMTTPTPNVSINNNLHYLQNNSNKTISIGQTSATRFSVISKQIGTYRLKVMVTVKGKYAQSTRYLVIKVV